VFINDPPHQYAAFVDDLNLAILRVSLDPCLGPKGISDVTLFLSAYGVAPERLGQLRDEWSALLAGLYPDGQSV
jgi:hypothetical protein